MRCSIRRWISPCSAARSFTTAAAPVQNMNDTSLATDTSVAAGLPGLSRGLRSRHVTMISIGGIIGAGLFVGSSAAIAAIGPAVIVSYLLAGIVILFVMRMLAEMVMAAPDVG